MLNTFNVQLRGRFVKSDLFSLQVLSTHRGVINLLDRENNYLISLIKDKKNMTGLSLLIPDLFAGSIEIETGVSLCVSVAKTGFKPVSTADIWPDTPIPQKLDLRIRSNEMDALKKNLDTGDSFFSLLSGKDKTPYQLKAREILERYIHLSNQKIHGLEKLVGLGQGLTPSGDDFITGALLAEVYLNGSVHIDRNAIERILEKTTYAGRTLLFLALKGSFPAYLLAFVKEISESIGEDLFLKAVNRASQHGSTSGLDSLAGFYWYIGLMNF